MRHLALATGLIVALSVATPAAHATGVPVVDALRNISAEIHNTLQKAHWVQELAKYEESIRKYVEIVKVGTKTYKEAEKIYKVGEKTFAVMTGERPWYRWRGTVFDKSGRRFMPETWGDISRVARTVGRNGTIDWDDTRNLGRIADIMGETRDRYGHRTIQDIFGDDAPDLEWVAILEDETASAMSSRALAEVGYDRIEEQLTLIEEDQAKAREAEDLKSSIDYLGYATNAARMEALNRERLMIAQLHIDSQRMMRETREMQEAHALFRYEEERGAPFLFD